MYSNAQYADDADGNVCGICVYINGVTSFVPCDPANSEYQRIMALVEAGELVIAPAAPPAPPQPATLTARQLRLQLLALGVTGAQVEAIIAAIPDATEREAARIEWEYSTVYERTHPLIAAVASALRMTDAQIDAAWMQAATL